MMKRNFLRSFFLMVFVGLLVASVSAPSEARAPRSVRSSRFDGQWSVVINTLYGNCGEALRYSLRIAGGRVLAEDPSYQAAGAVASNGAIHVVVAQGGNSASGYGRLVGNNGRGRWRTSTGECSGVWVAERRAAYW